MTAPGPGTRGFGHARLPHGATIEVPVETTQIAPTILTLLGLSPAQLQAVRIEHTRVLPGAGWPAGH